MKNLDNFSTVHLFGFIRNKGIRDLVRYWLLFTLLLVSLASMAFYGILATESNPFFYANF